MLHKFRVIISLFLLVAFCAPTVGKALHELEHTAEEHCDEADTHFCGEDHSCSICDFIFATSASSIVEGNQTFVFKLYASESVAQHFVPCIISSPKYTFSLRGPPLC